MSLFKSYWTVEGISPDARDAALRAADASGEDLGVWLSRLINRVGLAERDAETVADDRAEDPVEALADDAADDATAADTEEAAAEVPEKEAAEERDDKMSSIERAMLQSRAAADG